MRIGELWNGAFQDNHFSLALLLDFLLHEKKVVTMDDDISELAKYTAERHRKAMNEHLEEYLQKKRHDPQWIVRSAADIEYS
jgi:hypothetical protein